MNVISKLNGKRMVAAFMTILMVMAMLPVNAFAWSADEGTKCTSTYGDRYVGYDGEYYYSAATSNVLFYNEDGSTYVVSHNGGNTRWKYMMIDSTGSHQVYCIESGVAFNYDDTYTSKSGTNSKYFQNLPVTAQYGIMMALMYGWHEGMSSPVSGTNADDFALATQCIIWEYQQQIRTSPTSLASNNGVAAGIFYDTIKGRPAELCYNWLLDKISQHYTVPSFTSRNKNSASTYTLKYDDSKGNYSLTLTDTNNTLADINFSASGITVTRSGNQYTFTSKEMISNPVSISAQKNVNLPQGKMAIWGCPGKQTMASGAEDPVYFYLNIVTETKGVGHIVKTSEDGKVEGITFTIKGNGVNETVKTGKNGTVDIELMPGTYTVTEQSLDLYEDQAAQTITIVSGQTATVTFNNTLKRGDLEVVKTSEDGLVEGVKFHLFGTSQSGYAVDEYAVTNSKGIATFKGVLIGTGYTLEEVDTGEQYIVPDNQTAAIEWNKVTHKSVDNELKRGELKVIKSSEDNFVEGVTFRLYGTSLSGIPVDESVVTDSNGVATFKDILISGSTPYTLTEVNTAVRYVVPEDQTAPILWNEVTNRSFDNILKKFTVTVTKQDSEKGKPQGDATLAGAKYGIYRGDELVDVYYTDENGQFTTAEYICGDDWTIKEIEPSEGYLLDSTVHHVGAEAKNFTVEHNTVAVDVGEDVIKGNVAIIKHTDNGETQIETPEEGAKFVIYLKSAGSYDKADPDEKDELVCDENGFAESKYMPYGVYTVHQVSGWEGRELMKDFDVYVSKDGETYRYIINNRDFESYIKVVKTDAETGVVIPYAGAGFQLYRPDGELVTMTFTYPTPVVIDTFYTDEDGCFVTPERLEYGKGYYLIEVQAPYGYTLDSSPVYFDVTENNSTEEGGVTVIKVNKTNVPQKGIIEISKSGEVFFGVNVSGGVDENGAELPVIYQPVYEVAGLEGAVYTIRAAEDIITPDGTVRNVKGEVVDTIKTGKDGLATSRELYLGKYEVEEIEAPFGMVLSSEVHAVELTYAGQNVSVTETATSFYNERQKVEVSLLKSLETDTLFGIGMNGEIRNITFGLFAAEELVASSGTSIPTDGLIEIISLDENGNGCVQSDLPIGSYYIQELTTDEHYILNDTKFPVIFSYEGQEVASVELAVNNGDGIDNELIYGSVAGLKVDENDEPLSGVLIGLFAFEDGEFTKENALMTTVSEEDGRFYFEGIPYGTWYVREIEQPAGFILDDTVYPVTISEDEQVVCIGIINEYIHGNISLTKVDADYPENKLTGASFEVYKDSNDNGEFDEGDELLGTLDEVETGIYTMTDLLYGRYFVRETKAPDGFLLDEGVYEVFIDTDGMTYEVENKAGVGFINEAMRGTLKIVKTSSDGVVKGFAFTITGDNGYSVTLETDENGEIVIEGLRIGNYVVSEVANAASAPYVLPADKTATVQVGSTTIVEMHNTLRDTPKTGDESNIGLWYALAGIAALGIAVCGVVAFKKKKKEDND